MAIFEELVERVIAGFFGKKGTEGNYIPEESRPRP